MLVLKKIGLLMILMLIRFKIKFEKEKFVQKKVPTNFNSCIYNSIDVTRILTRVELWYRGVIRDVYQQCCVLCIEDIKSYTPSVFYELFG